MEGRRVGRGQDRSRLVPSPTTFERLTTLAELLAKAGTVSSTLHDLAASTLASLDEHRSRLLAGAARQAHEGAARVILEVNKLGIVPPEAVPTPEALLWLCCVGAAALFGLGTVKRWSRSRRIQPADMATLEVQWDREKYTLALPPPQVTLGQLKQHLSAKTGVAVEHMKLLVHGCPMKDDSLPLSSYGISLPPPGPPSPPEDDSFRARGRRSGFLSGLWPSILENSKPPPVFKIRMIGSTATKAVVSDRPDLRPPAPTEKPATAPAPTEAVGAATVLDERSLATQITDLVDEAKRTLGPQVDELESSLAPPAPRSPRNSLTPPPAPAAMAKTLSGSSTPLHVYLSEMLLQRLLKLDSFSVPADWTAARAARKEGVRTIQTYLDRVDSARSELQKRARSTQGR